MTTTNNTTKNINVSFFQNNDKATKLEFLLELSTDNESTVIGTMLNELFFYISEYKKAGAKLFNLKDSIQFRVESDNKIFNSTDIDIVLQQRLKLGYNAKKKRSFAKSVIVAINVLNRVAIEKTKEQVIAEIEQEIALISE